MSRSIQSAYDRGFITKIEIKDHDTGRVKSSLEVITYRGLLNLAHEEDLKRVQTTLVQIPTQDNQMTAIVMAEVETGKGVFTAIGDASPDNVNARVRRAIIRMAETRAKARAFRDAVNIGIVALEELGQDEAAAADEAPPPVQGPPGNGTASNSSHDLPMTDSQRRYIFKLLAEDGVPADKMADHLRELLRVDSLKELSRKQASAVIDYLTNENNDRTEVHNSWEPTTISKVG